ncbi:MAG TPA: hypothetical protein PLW65_21980 [Pseudomonadota bacterium]|nr:hypothetical protein [Pseudomonadota bacterium]
MSTTHESLTPLPREASLPAVPSRHAAPRPLSRRALRKVLNRALGLPSQLEAFFVDFYPEVYSRTAIGMDREAQLNLLLSHVPEAQLTHTLRQEYPQETAQVELSSGLSSSSLSDERRTRYTVVLLATISDMDVHKVYALLNHLRKYTADSELTIEEVRSGSVVLACIGSEEGFIRLYTDYRVGHLNEILGYRIKAVKLGYGETLSRVIAHLEPPVPPLSLRPQGQAQVDIQKLAGQLGMAGPGRAPSPLVVPPLAASSRSKPASTVTLRAMSHPALVTEALRGDKKPVTAELKLSSGHRWLLWFLCTVACVAIVAWLGERQYRRELVLPRLSVPGPEDISSSPASSRSDGESAPPDQRQGPAHAPDKNDSFPNVAARSVPLSPKTGSPLQGLQRDHKPLALPPKDDFRRSAVVVRCSDSGPCPKAATQRAVRSCIGRYLPEAGAGRLVLQRVGATYVVARRPRGAGEAVLAALIGCVQSDVAELYGLESAGWPTALRLTLSGPPSHASGDTSGDASGDAASEKR